MKTESRHHIDTPGIAWGDAVIRLTTRDGRKLHNRGHGTCLLRWIDGAWKVVHTQSAGSAVRDGN